MHLCRVFGLIFALEQPETSLAFRHPRFQAYLQQFVVYARTFYLGSFGAESPKPVTIYSNSLDFLEGIHATG